jgi:shikimate kinase
LWGGWDFMNLVLIGYRGTGKSAVARILAGRLGWPSVDADLEIESRDGKSIAKIFADDGEPAFRDYESQVVADLATRDQCVVALGGGALMREQNRKALGDRGTIVWLKASPETLLRRIQADEATGQRRPNLTAQGGITEIIATLDARIETYRQCADFEVDTEDRTPEEVADAILGQWNRD